MTLKCLIADDEPLAHTLLENYIARLKTLSVVGHAYNAFEVLDFLSENPVDILFLDINMPDLTGLDMLKTLSNPPMVILTTAYSEHSLEAFELGVMDYLLKPIKFERFLKAVNRIIEIKKPVIQNSITPLVSTTISPIENTEKTEKSHNDFIFIKDGTTNYKINFNDLLYIQAYGNFAKIHTSSQTILASITMKHLEDDLPENIFTRVHKSYIINIQKVGKIEGNTAYIDKTAIPIGAVYKLALDKKIKN
jgi:DNA-binding LytR/AlgR family response regulator